MSRPLLAYPEWLRREQRKRFWLGCAKNLLVIVGGLVLIGTTGLVVGALAAGVGLR